MKKTLAVAAVLAAFAGSAAADVTLYGRVDTGFVYSNTDIAGVETDKFGMENGWSTGSRWGVKGTEDLGNGMKAGFVLESGFTADDGQLNNDGRLFGREAVVTLEGGFGKLYLGRIASLASDSGSMGLLGNVAAFGNCYGIGATTKGSTGSAFARYDNTVGYVSPAFSGFQLSAQYSLKGDQLKDSKNAEADGDADRYAAVGFKYAAGALTAVATVDYTMYGNVANGDIDDGMSAVAGFAYALDGAKVFAKVAYFDNQKAALDTFKVVYADATQVKGYGAEVGTKFAALGGNVMAAVGYRVAEDVDNAENEFTRLNVGVGYTYAFSKNTNVYAAVSYAEEKADLDDEKAKGYNVGFGLVHKF